MEKMFGLDGATRLILCNCGGLRLASGAVTIHFGREEFQVFAESIRRLASIIAEPSLSQASLATQSSLNEVYH